MKSILKNTTFLILFLLSNSVLSQQQEYIVGKLIDAKTQESIAFASIRIKDRALGIISNTDGGFKIPLKYRDYGEIIEISSMGYQTREISIQDLSTYEMNTIGLQPAILEPEEAIVTAKEKNEKRLSAKKIVEIAIGRILENYPVTPYSKVGYYRDYQMDDGEYVNLNEAILEVFDEGFKSIDTTSTETLMYNYTRNENFKRDTLADDSYNYKTGSKIIENAYMSGFGGNEFSSLKVHDAIRNYQLDSFDFINNMKEGDILKHHSFKRLQNIYLNDKMLYVVQFRKNENNYSAKGTIYVGINDFAIHKLEYVVYDRTKRNEKQGNGELIFEVISEYKRNVNNKMYLNYISFHNTFQLREPPLFVLNSIKLDMARRSFIFTFNNIVDSGNAIEYINYEVYFRGEPIKFERVLVLGNRVLLFPKLQTKKQMGMWHALKIAGENNDLNKDILDFNIQNIRDVEGNLINDRILKNYNQFREFFVQEIKLESIVPIDSLFIHKRKPIFENQLIVKPENFDDYWMNTPLQNIKS